MTDASGNDVKDVNGTNIYPYGLNDSQDSDNFTVSVDDMNVIANYTFSIKAIKEGGENLSQSINITVVCGPESATIVKDTAPATFSKYLYDTTNFYSFPNYTSTHSQCPVIATSLFVMEEDRKLFPKTIDWTSPFYDPNLELNLVLLKSV